MSEKRIKVVEEVISNEDLLLQVFLCLPAKSLIRFKCVSKQWLSLISDPKFCIKYTRLNPSSPILGIYYVYKNGFLSHRNLKVWSGPNSVSLHQVNRKDLPTLTYIKNGFPGSDSMMPKIMYSCNGLFLCSYSRKRSYLVCNFTTKKFTILPQHLLSASGYYHNDDSAFLFFDPLKSPDYKVLLFNVCKSRHDMNLHHEDEYKGKTGDCSGGGCYEIDVYSSKTGVWKRFYFRAQHSLHRVDYMAVCNGALHWITFDKFHGRFEIDTTKLIFNPLPPKPKGLDLKKVRYFGESYGHLFLICIPWRTAEMFNVLELDPHNSIWTRKYHVHMSPLIASFPDSFDRATKNGTIAKRWSISIICVVKEDEVHGFALLLAMPGKIVSYNLNNKKFRVIGELPIQECPLYTSYTDIQSFPFMANMSPI